MIDGPAAGQRVKELMERRGWSLGTLADRSGVDKGHLSVMLRGRVPHLWYLVTPPGQTRQTRQFGVVYAKNAPGMALVADSKKPRPDRG